MDVFFKETIIEKLEECRKKMSAEGKKAVCCSVDRSNPLGTKVYICIGSCYHCGRRTTVGDIVDTH